MIRCSFLLSTYNKLETLKNVLQNFIDNRIEGVEIVVADGCSNDGTVNYLIELENKGLIDKVILSKERDLGEWHGFKKALDLASGEYIKFMTDDDAFDYKAIEECLLFLENNREVDWLISQGYSKQFGFMHYSGYHEIIKQKNSTKPEINGMTEGLCGLGFFIKRSITKKLDLLNNNYGARTDRQISSELTNSDYKGCSTNLLTWVRILNEKSNTLLHSNSLENKNIKEVNKNFKINEEKFKKDHSDCVKQISNQNNKITKEFLIF